MTWHKVSTGNHQALIIDEKTGANIAVVYDGEKDADLIAAAPELLRVLEYALGAWECRHPEAAVRKIREAIQKAKGE